MPDIMAQNAFVQAKKALEQATKDVTPFTPTDVLSTVVLADADTAAASTFNSLPVPTSQAYKVSVLGVSNTSNGTFTVLYSPDGVQEIATTVTQTADAVSGKFNYRLILEAPVYSVRFRFLEGAAAGHIYGSVTMIEKKVK